MEACLQHNGSPLPTAGGDAFNDEGDKEETSP